jgi:Fe-Mn family superoxide dismutase
MQFNSVYHTLLEEKQGGYKPEPLPYKFQDLEPILDKESVEIHYNKLYKNYIKKLNELMQGSTPPILELIQKAKTLDSKIAFNAGGYYNHSFFWKCLTPGGQKMSPEFKDTVTRKYQSPDNLKEEFIKKALTLQGSGWCWLVDKEGELDIILTHNQENPLEDTANGIPLLGIDMFEHVYFLKYHSDKEKYLRNVWKLIDWNFVSLNSSATLG